MHFCYISGGQCLCLTNHLTRYWLYTFLFVLYAPFIFLSNFLFSSFSSVLSSHSSPSFLLSFFASFFASFLPKGCSCNWRISPPLAHMAHSSGPSFHRYCHFREIEIVPQIAADIRRKIWRDKSIQCTFIALQWFISFRTKGCRYIEHHNIIVADIVS